MFRCLIFIIAAVILFENYNRVGSSNTLCRSPCPFEMLNYEKWQLWIDWPTLISESIPAAWLLNEVSFYWTVSLDEQRELESGSHGSVTIDSMSPNATRGSGLFWQCINKARLWVGVQRTWTRVFARAKSDGLFRFENRNFGWRNLLFLLFFGQVSEIWYDQVGT